MFNLELFLHPIPSENTLWIAYSGGMDSHVLLHAIVAEHKRNQSLKIKAIHINHQLNPLADTWETHCQQICDALAIPLVKLTVDASPKRGESPEASARAARYTAFNQHMEAGDYIATGHHQDDQAETFMLRLLRGAGPKGLTAMASKRSQGKGLLIRPLLEFSRNALAEYAHAQGLIWINDNSNSNTQFDRNYLRQIVMPLLEQRWPKAAATIARSASHSGQAQKLLVDLATSDYAAATGSQPKTLSIKRLIAMPAHRQHNLIRYWLNYLKLTLPTVQQLAQLTETVLACAADANPKLHWPGTDLRRYRDDLYAFGLLPNAPTKELRIKWDLKKPLVMPNGLGTLMCEQAIGKGIRQFLLQQPFEIRFRQGGETCQPHGRKETHTIKKLFQEWGVPPWQRDCVPLLYYKTDLVAVIGFCITESFAADPYEDSFNIGYLPRL